MHEFAWHWRGPHLLNVVVLAVADGLFGLCGSERRDELVIVTLSLCPPSLIIMPYVASADVKQHDKEKNKKKKKRKKRKKERKKKKKKKKKTPERNENNHRVLNNRVRVPR